MSGNPLAIAAADFDGDGRTDIVTVSQGALSYLHSKAQGGFDPAVLIPAPAAPGLTGLTYAAVSAVDLNHDGKPDLVVLHVGEYAGVLINNGNGTFQPETLYETVVNTGPGFVLPMRTGDFTGDGNTDVMVAGCSGLQILRGDGAGGLGSTRVVASTGGFSSVSTLTQPISGKRHAAATTAPVSILDSIDFMGLASVKDTSSS